MKVNFSSDKISSKQVSSESKLGYWAGGGGKQDYVQRTCASLLVLASFISWGYATPPTRPSTLPYMKCRMWETPPNWASTYEPLADMWEHDVNFPPMVLLNLDSLPTTNSAQAAADRVSEIADRYGDYISLMNGTSARTAFDSDLAVALLNFGGDHKQLSTNPTRFIVPDSGTDLVYSEAGNEEHKRAEYHFWQGTGIETAKTWTIGTNGFLSKLESKVANNLLSSLPTRFICDTEIPANPVLLVTNGISPLPVDRVNQSRRFIAMLADSRAGNSGSGGAYKIPYKSSDGLTLSDWMSRATGKFYPSIFLNGSVEPWLSGSAVNVNQNLNLGQEENRQFGIFYERLWQMQIDGAIKYALMDPLASRTGWTNTKVSNYAFVQTDDDFDTDSSVSTAGSLPVESSASRVRGGPPFEYGWHFKRTNFTNNPFVNATVAATRVNLIGTKEIRNEGAPDVGVWTSAGFRRLYTGESGSLHLSAPGMYTADPVHKGWDLYAPPTASPFQPYPTTIAQSGTPNAPLESNIESVVRLFRYNLESVLYSGKANTSTLSVTPWLSMPDIDHDQVFTECDVEAFNGPLLNVDDELLRRTLQLCYQFDLRESNVFGLNTGFCRPREPNTECILPTYYVCESGDYDVWQRFQTIYYQVMNPWVEDAGIFRGYDYQDNTSPNNPEGLRNTVRTSGGDVATWDVGSDILNNGGSHTGLEVTIAGFTPQSPLPGSSVVHTLRLTIETEHFFGENAMPDEIAGEIRIFVRTYANPTGSWQTLNITDYDAHTGTSDPRRGKYGAWSPDRSVRRMFEFQVRPDHVVDADGRMKLIFLETAHDKTTGQPSNEDFVTRFDYVHAMIIPPESTTVGGGGENLMARDYDPGADQNMDGAINTLDIAQFSLDYIDEVGAADTNGDNTFTAEDITLFLETYSANQQ